MATRRNQTKLCRRTGALRSGTAPTQSDLRRELGPELADAIMATMEPACQAAMGVDRQLKGPPAGHSYDPEALKGNIHEHILRLGGQYATRLDAYWRNRVKAARPKEDIDFVRFECNQRVEIVQDVERQRYEEKLVAMQKTLTQQFWEEKGEIHRSYEKARQLWAKFVCRKMRTQTRELLCRIARKYRTEMHRELEVRMQEERSKLVADLEGIVRSAVKNQRALDEGSMRQMVAEYEEIIAFLQTSNKCREMAELVREVYQQEAKKPVLYDRSAQMSTCSVEPIVDYPEEDTGNESDTTDSYDVEMPPDGNDDEVFVIRNCLPKPEELTFDKNTSVEDLVHVVSESASSTGDPLERPASEGSVEKVILDGVTYAQPKYYSKVFDQLFPELSKSCWEFIHPESSSEAIRAPYVDQSSLKSNDALPTDDQRQSVDKTVGEGPNEDSTEGENFSDVQTSTCVDADETDALFDFDKTDEEIIQTIDNIVAKYIRATEAHFDEIFQRNKTAE